MSFLMENWQNLELAAIRMGFGEDIFTSWRKLSKLTIHCKLARTVRSNAGYCIICNRGWIIRS